MYMHIYIKPFSKPALLGVLYTSHVIQLYGCMCTSVCGIVRLAVQLV